MFFTCLHIRLSSTLCILVYTHIITLVCKQTRLNRGSAISGLIIGQLIIFLSIYFSPLYVILIKPHIVILQVLSYILFYWYRTKDLLDYQSLCPITSISDAWVHKIFLDSFILQLLNPVLLLSLVLTRNWSIYA